MNMTRVWAWDLLHPCCHGQKWVTSHTQNPANQQSELVEGQPVITQHSVLFQNVSDSVDLAPHL